MTDMIVSGAGTTAVNGTYVENGTVNGKPKYTFGNYYIYWSNGYVASNPPDEGGWTLANGGNWYVSPDNTATPDLATWQVGFYTGAAPAPTITAASTGVPKQYLHYARLRSN